MDKNEISRLLKVCELNDLDNAKDVEKLEHAVKEFCGNIHFQNELSQCPNDLLKCYYVLNYAISEGHAEYDKARDCVKKKFTNYEWQYLIDHTTNITAKICWSKMLKKE